MRLTGEGVSCKQVRDRPLAALVPFGFDLLESAEGQEGRDTGSRFEAVFHLRFEATLALLLRFDQQTLEYTLTDRNH